MDPSDPVQTTITQLEQARGIALADAKSYVQIVPGVLPIIGAGAAIELKRWGSEFLAETFASPQLAQDEKQALCLKALPVLNQYLDAESEDMFVVKEAVQSAASIYPLVFRHTIFNPSDSTSWQLLNSIKGHILGRMDDAPAAVRICCVKFIQRVVQTQTPGVITDPRRPEANEVSIALVPRDHPLMQPDNLEAEASGLLDRILGILQENSSDALLVTATLNCLGALIRSRASIANKIVNTVLYFNPLKLANSPMTPANRLKIKSMERTTRALLLNVIKKNPSHPLAGRIHEYLEHMRRSRTEILDVSRKRAAPVDVEVVDTKRQRVAPEVAAQFNPPTQQLTPQPQFPPLPPGPVSLAQLFTLTDDPGSKNFNVRAIPHDVVVRIVIALLQTIPKNELDIRVNAVRARYLNLAQQQSASAFAAGARPTEDADEDDDYEPTLPTEDAEQIANKLDSFPPPVAVFQEGLFPDVQLGPYRIPDPEPLSQLDAIQVGRQIIDRMFASLRVAEVKPKGANSTVGFNRLAATGQDRDSLVTLICRIATRATGLEPGDDSMDGIKKEHNGDSKFLDDAPIPSYIREQMNLFVVEDFRQRIDCAIAWLTEEWFNDTVNDQKSHEERHSATSNGASNGTPVQNRVATKRHYRKWTLKFMDEIFHYLDRNDRKLLIRFLAEIPELDRGMLTRVQALTTDPDRVAMTIQALQYLILFKPPVRDLCLDVVEDLWKNSKLARRGCQGADGQDFD
ncbi:mRNA cleavage and polyadenylation specificity factor complex subunit [Eremomyces bilateralis CBS 781.70]|uniref:mRNA cleavage and polyadenylation specificity factor complex subunit n=1 Tax=Eremomyces bilateralis CBS 781.70 TaxID=1392243 RepID=A0A6G1FS96_9PEZI|nr:mRNA cleavage and polyadenylation specificity factor complex subunit [Eremomyces bilateralis CBS 781.70]KAF1808643.1 mRNA cleavage and polyadenylation specificity factor complex subunit [Eremomyces bilateralis CBS 781.70]